MFQRMSLGFLVPPGKIGAMYLLDTTGIAWVSGEAFLSGPAGVYRFLLQKR